MKADFLIIGQGIAGTVLGMRLIKAGKSVMIVDKRNPLSASRISSGVINPYSGKRMVKVKDYDMLAERAITFYREMEQDLGAVLLQESGILVFHGNEESRELFVKKEQGEDRLLHALHNTTRWEQYFNSDFGAGEIAPCYLLDQQVLLDRSRAYFAEQGMLLEEQFEWGQCLVSEDKVRYKDIEAGMLICCEGVDAVNNPYFPRLPYNYNKGEVVIAYIPGLPRERIYKRDIVIVPWREEQFWIGTTFQWSYDDVAPTDSFRKLVEGSLGRWLKLPYTINDHWASLRPTTLDHQPFVGISTGSLRVAIVNGLGTKGGMIAPYLSDCMARHLTDGIPLPKEISIGRLKKEYLQV